MNGFTRTHFVVGALVVVSLMWQAADAFAQFAPRRSFSGDRVGSRGSTYYGYDPVIYPNINQTNAALQQSYNQARAYQAQSSMTRTSAWQNINQSMAQQADMRTQSMTADRQSAKDWWFQTQAQQVASRQARASYQPMSLPPLSDGTFDDSASKPRSQASAPKEIMIWPTLLKNSQFDDYRNEVEAPFRRAYADKKPLTADDYRGILNAIDKMKIKLEGMSLQIIESEHATVNGYLDELAADAQKRLDARLSPNPATDKTEAAEKKS